MSALMRLALVVVCVAGLAACKADSGSSSAPVLAPDVGGGGGNTGGGGGNGGGNNGGGNPTFQQEFTDIDLHTRQTPALASGEIELLTLSTFPDTVSGGDVLIALRGLAQGQSVALELNGVAVSPELTRDAGSGELRALITGLADGDNVIAAEVSDLSRRVELTVRNHPITGPIISGPHQSPFVCRTNDPAVGLGEPTDLVNCSIDTVYEWYYRKISDQQYALLDPEATSYPSDMQMTVTSEGESVPFIVRMESATINRGIARIGVLDDPVARNVQGGSLPFDPHWNKRVYYIFGESCGVGYDQGRNDVNYVLGPPPAPNTLSADRALINFVGGAERLGRGDIVVHSTLSAFGVHCNPFVSVETTMMIKEHITEQYGLVEQFIGSNGSGAALQQYNAANNAPGLLTAAMPTATFADIASTAMTVTDCGLLYHYFLESNPGFSSSPEKMAAIAGHRLESVSICSSWDSAFFNRVVADEGCLDAAPAGEVGPQYRYDKVSNPQGSRCTIQDANINWLGSQDHPEVPGLRVARRPLDNVGVQYGLQALLDGVISGDEFIALNRDIGGLDIDGKFVPERHVMDPSLASLLHEIGQVIGRGSLAETPIIDLAPYLDLVPVLNIHESVRPFNVRARRALRDARANGHETRVVWRGVLTQPDAFEQIDAWTAALRDLPPSGNRVADVHAAKPDTLVDTCSFSTTGGQLEFPTTLLLPLGGQLPLLPADSGLPGQSVPLQVNAPESWDEYGGPANATDPAPCARFLPVVQTPRMVAGMPISDDILKCQLKPIEPLDYAGQLNSVQLAELATIFPNGVCDYSKPGVGDLLSTENSMRWPSLGTLGSAPTPLQWRAVRSKPAP